MTLFNIFVITKKLMESIFCKIEHSAFPVNTFYKVFQNECSIVVGFNNLSVWNFDAYLKSNTKYQEPLILTKSVCNGFKPIITP
jgi:hypothetical protein